MPTLIGIVFFLVSAYCFFRNDDSLFAVVMVSAIFQASSVFLSKKHGVQPFYAVAALFVLQSALRGRHAKKVSFRGKRWMLWFALIAVASAIVLPVVFAGIPVYDPYVGIDAGLILRPPLHLGLANFTQSVYLLLEILVVLGAAGNVRGANHSVGAYRLAFYLAAGTVFAQFICAQVGIPFPYSLIQTHGGYMMQHVHRGGWSSRYPGTFSESSFAGAVLTSFTAGFLAERIKFGRSLLPALLGLVAIFLVRSTASIAAIGLVFAAILVAHPVFRFPYYVNAAYLKRGALLIGTLAFVVVLVGFSPLRQSILHFTMDKSDSASFVDRVASDLYALRLFVQTHGMGVGMGSNRPSSLITSLLSTVGAAGFLVFLVAYARVLSNCAGRNSWMLWAGGALFLDMALCVPDYTAPWVWVELAFALQMGRLSQSMPGERSAKRGWRTVIRGPQGESSNASAGRGSSPTPGASSRGC